MLIIKKLSKTHQKNKILKRGAINPPKINFRKKNDASNNTHFFLRFGERSFLMILVVSFFILHFVGVLLPIA